MEHNNKNNKTTVTPPSSSETKKQQKQQKQKWWWFQSRFPPRCRFWWTNEDEFLMFFTDEKIDLWLDQLRDTNLKLPVLVQIVGSWIVASVVLAYYSLKYYYYYLYGPPSLIRTWSTKNQPPTLPSQIRLPLMTEAKGTETSLDETYAQLRELLQQCDLLLPTSVTTTRTHDGMDASTTKTNNAIKWMTVIRQHSDIRRLVSRFMQFQQYARALNADLFDFLDSIYDSELLPLPSSIRIKDKSRGGDTPSARTTTTTTTKNDSLYYDISVIVPYHEREPSDLVQRTLDTLHKNCQHPHCVQLVLVHAVDPNLEPPHNHNSNNDDNDNRHLGSKVKTQQYKFANVKCVTYGGGGGRGPTMNFGASCSQGHILVFVHSDCHVPKYWDAHIQSRLIRHPEITSCAFLFGVDCRNTSWWESLFRTCALSWSDTKTGDNDTFTNRQHYPWGIQAIRIMVNLRSYLLSMPYGDQAIAMRRCDFDYIGGFPNQPIMEDYDLMHYLRHRSTAMKRMNLPFREAFALIPSTCWCSPRRWQRSGVLYVTLSNAVLVHRYSRTADPWTPAQVFEYYYHRPYSYNHASQQRHPTSSTDENNRTDNTSDKTSKLD